MRIILASSSPRRRLLLEQIGLAFEAVECSAEEVADPHISPGELVMINAERKAAAAEFVKGDALIIAADTIVSLDGQVLGKTRGESEARSMLERLSGRMHTVYTGVYLRRTGGVNTTASFTEQADVYMRDIGRDEITEYIKTGEPMDKAGAYGLQGIGAVFVKRVEGDYSTVIGLPLCALWQNMRKLGCV